MKDFNFLTSIEVRLIKNTESNWKKLDNDPELDIFEDKLSI